MPPGDEVAVEMDGFPRLRCTVAKVSRPGAKGTHCVKLAFELEGECRDQMTVKLYTGRYSQDIHELDRSAILEGVLSRLFGKKVNPA